MKFKDLTGMKFGNLTILSVAYRKKKHIYWNCKCNCGNLYIARGSHIVGGRIISCGCFHRKRVGEIMKTRCYNPHSENYKNYGGRGIKICKEWLNDYTKFSKWAYLNGYNENAKKMECTIDRINVNGNYEPSNYRWVDMSVQNKNKRRRKSKYSKEVLEKIQKYCNLKISEISKKINLSENQIRVIMKYYKTSIKEMRKLASEDGYVFKE